MIPRLCRRLALPLVSLSVVFLSACSDDSDDGGPPPGARFSADIVWTEYGVPHITAGDFGSAGYGVGYSYARENFCTTMKEYVRAAGESSRYLGDEGDLDTDLAVKMFNADEKIQRMLDEDLSPDIVDLLTGYAAGVNRYLNETGVDNLAEGEEGCRGEPWVREIDVTDTVRLLHKTVLRASGLAVSGGLSFPAFLVAAEPSEAVAKLKTPEGLSAEQYIASEIAGQDYAGMLMPPVEQLGSNAYAIGEQASQTNSGLMFGNPHFPWQGQERFFMFHLILGDDYNLSGAALGGLPAPVIGFNRDVAWSHTVSTGNPRTVFHELQLNPDNPLQYLYDGELRDFTPETVSVERMVDGGAIETVEHTFYHSHIGPVLDLGALSSLLAGWPNAVGTVLVYSDANLENLRGLEQWYRMGQASSIDELKEALRPIGIPWVNTIAADRHGDAFYGDVSAHPHASTQLRENCVRGLLQQTLTDNGFLTIDGSDSECELGQDEGTVAGIFGFDNLPYLDTREYGANANDSYWLPNPRQLLEGFPEIIGSERTEQSRRTRATFTQAEERIAGTDGLGDPGFNIDNLKELSFQAKNYTADLVLDEVLTVCQAIPEDPEVGVSMEQEACSILGGWDRHHRVDSVGGHIFYELWRELRGTENMWATPFDAADPVNTPRDLDIANPDVEQAVLDALSAAVTALADAGIALDAPWGEVQFDEKNGVRYGIHGGSGDMMFSVITSSLVDGEGYADIRHGNSYMQAVTWDETDCPVAYNIITYSQSTDPASAHYADMTELYSNSGWVDAAYCLEDIEASEIARMTVTE